MLIYIDENRKITGYNTIIPKEESQKYLQKNYCVWLDEEIDYTQLKEGYQTVIYLNEDNTLRYEFEKPVIVEPEPTQLDRIKNIEEAVSKSITELRQEGYDNCVMDMVKEGVI